MRTINMAIRNAKVLTLILALAAVFCVAPHAQAEVIYEGSFADDYAGSDPMPQAGVWSYYGAWGSDPTDTTGYVALGWNTSYDAWTYGGAYQVSVGYGGNVIRGLTETNTTTGHSVPVVEWESPVTGTAEVTLDGKLQWGYSSSPDMTFGVLDKDGNVLYSTTIDAGATFQETVSDIDVATGESLYIYAQPVNKTNSDQRWIYTAADGAPIGDGIKVTVTPEPATMGLLGIGGLALLRRRSRKA